MQLSLEVFQLGGLLSRSPIQMALSHAGRAILSSRGPAFSFPRSALKFSESPQGPIKYAAKRGAELDLEIWRTWQDLAIGPKSSHQGAGAEADPPGHAGVEDKQSSERTQKSPCWEVMTQSYAGRR